MSGMSARPAPRAGWVPLFLGVALFSTIEVASKEIGTRVHPLQMVFLRFFLTGLVLLGLAAPSLRRRAVPLQIEDYGLFLLNGVIGFSASIVLFHWAILMFEKAASCAVVFSANPIFILFVARFVNREPWNVLKWTAMAAGAAGVAFFAWESGGVTSQSLAGLGLMLASAFLFAVSICLVRRVIARYGVFILTGFSALFGSLVVLPFAVAVTARYGADGLARAWAPTLYVALAGTAMGYGLYYFGLSRSTLFQASMMFFLKPVLASLLAVLLLHETINGFMLAGSGFILAGLALTVGNQLLERRRNKGLTGAGRSE